MADEQRVIGELKEEIACLRARLNQLSIPLEGLLQLRGFRVYSMEPMDDLILPPPDRVDDFYRMMKKYSFRLFLRDVIKVQSGFRKEDVTRYATAEVTDRYIRFLSETGLILEQDGVFRLDSGDVSSFGDTLEWFVAEVLRREFHGEVLRGVKFRGKKSGGDYDILARVNGDLLFMEVKSSPPRQVYESEVRAFWSRVYELSPDIAVFFMDTHLRMKDKLVPMFEDELKRRHETPPHVRRIEAELFGVEDRVFLVNSKPSVEDNIGKILSHYIRRRFQWKKTR
jgi:Holliday junction resolvase-like predicted endonuclease